MDKKCLKDLQEFTVRTYVCTCTYVLMYVHVCTYVYVRMCMNVCTYVHVCMCTYVHFMLYLDDRTLLFSAPQLHSW